MADKTQEALTKKQNGGHWKRSLDKEAENWKGVCKAWHSASSTSSAMVESLPNRDPCFLLYGSSVTPQCKLVLESCNKYYTVTIPDLVGATCIASKQGWLLIFRRRSMFFCPFSGAKINLPEFPHKVFHGGASFSSTPTSPDCVVCAVCETDEDGTKKTECWELRRNATVWTMRDTTNRSMTHMTYCVYHEDSFSFCNNEDYGVTFYIKHGSLSRPFRVYHTTELKPGVKYLPWKRHIVEMDRVKEVLGLAEELTVPTCETVLAGNDNRIIINIPGECESDCLKGVWIQPRFHQIVAEQRW
ncbi:hypothetical protein SLEP1_g1211 [Rubroshorea leprosula]|uniref:KIB1-4 beta-propeller domain-containing protein n=1 Tax=Rubroshorea leprosula TaxID=152421 RepID=A0AAV5HMM8_9ROSI|nr:hypothetical protein SLEP1_g1211 [Rubroshorea leprosula]